MLRDDRARSPSYNRQRQPKIKQMSKGTMRLISRSFKKVQRAGGKVSRKMGLSYSEATFLALQKKKQDLEMAK